MPEYIYGKNAFNEAIETGRIRKAYLQNDGYVNLLRRKGIPFVMCERKELDRMAKGGNHQGVIGEVMDYQFATLDDMVKDSNGLIVVLDGLKDPHNLGAIIRSCEGAGVDGLIYKKHNAVSINETVSKVACGALEYVKVLEVTNITKTLQDLKKKGYWIVGSDGSGKQYYTDLDYNMNTVLVIGSEGEGISRLVLNECDFVVKLPMRGHINSLNASVAAGILIYNVLAKRNR